MRSPPVGAKEVTRKQQPRSTERERGAAPEAGAGSVAYDFSRRILTELTAPTERLYGEALCVALAVHLLKTLRVQQSRAPRILRSGAFDECDALTLRADSGQSARPSTVSPATPGVILALPGGETPSAPWPSGLRVPLAARPCSR